MAGHELKEATYLEQEINNDIFWSSVMSLLSSQSAKSTSYKFAFLKSILDNLYSFDNTYSMSYHDIFTTFTVVYWNLIIHHELRQMPYNILERSTVIERILYTFKEENNITNNQPFELLDDTLKQKIIKQVASKCSINVVGALFEDTKELWYSFSRKDKIITFNPQVITYLRKYKVIIEKLNYYEWAKYLETVNIHNSADIISKLELITKRNNLSLYKRILLDVFHQDTCFYCNKKLTNTSHVDHFVPWSFNNADSIWNFVLACSTCNTSKNDRLATANYLYKINERNKFMYQQLENTPLPIKEFDKFTEDTIDSLYKAAIQNGFNNNWKPK